MNDQACFAVQADACHVDRQPCGVAAVFPRRRLGSLCVHGTINDVAMSGAHPLILRRIHTGGGFSAADLKRIVQSMAAAAQDAGVAVVTGDTKVVERGKGDGSLSPLPAWGGAARIEISGDRHGRATV